MREEILKAALENAIKYNGKAIVNTVAAKVFSQLKVDDKATIFREINEVVNYVNSLDLEKQKEMFGGDVKKVKKEKVRVIPDLENVSGKVVMRFAPNPNGHLHFGHFRQALWNWFLVEKYNGEFILRYDDTDPKIKVPLKEAYKSIADDLKWIGIKPHKTVIQSKRLNEYYKLAKRLIYMEKAYVCTCDSEEWRKLVVKKKACPCRDLDVDTQNQRWEMMFKKYKEGEAVYRVKTDLENPDPAVRDWPGFRIIQKSKHPLDKKSRVWPLLNFASAIDDKEFNVTHIVRGIDLRISDDRQGYIYKYFGWKYPTTIYQGKLILKGTKSKTEIKEKLAAGELDGWDDPRLSTVMAFRKRGFKPEALIQFIKDLGIGKNDVQVSIENLNSLNRDIIDKEAGRYFFVKDPKKIKINGAPKLKTKILIHPDNPDGSARILSTNEEFYVSDEIKKGQDYRLIHLFNFKDNKFVSLDYDASVKTTMVHWVSVKDCVKVEVIMDDASAIKGFGETALRKLKVGSIVQFVRFGFCILDEKKKDKLKFRFTHN